MPTNTNQLLQTIIDPTTMHEVVSPKLHRILPHLEQHFIRINKSGRPVQLLRLIKQELEKRRPLIVFSNKSATSDYVSMFLNENGVNCINLNGDMPADLRIGQFEKFQSGQVDVLSTTDMASRGLDTTRVNYETQIKCLFSPQYYLFITVSSHCQLRFSTSHGRLYSSHWPNWSFGQP